MSEVDLVQLRSLVLAAEAELRTYRAECCPRCHDVPEELITEWRGAKRIGALTITAGRIDPPELPVTQAEAVALCTVARHYPGVCPTIQVQRALGHVVPHTAQVVLHRLRSKLPPYQVQLLNNRSGRGYQLVSLDPEA